MNAKAAGPRRAPNAWGQVDLAGLRLALYCRASKDTKDADYDFTEKSVSDQEAKGREWAAAHECVIVDLYPDNNKSASRYAKKTREHFDRLVADITAGKIDIIWMWMLDRSQRALKVYAELRDLCRERGMLWVVGGRVYDLSNWMDVQALSFAAVQGEMLPDIISENVKRGLDSSAQAGRPAGLTPYGYRRVFDSRTRRFVRQVADTEVRSATNAKGVESAYTRAGIVRELFRKAESGYPLIHLAQDLNFRGIPAPRGGKWGRSTIRRLLLNPAYIGIRRYKGEELDVEVLWDALIETRRFYAVKRILTAPERKTTRPARAKYLMSYIAHSSCGGVMQARHITPKGIRNHKAIKKSYLTYICEDGCTAILARRFDKFVEDTIGAWLAQPGLAKRLAPIDEDAAVVNARTEIDRLDTLIEQWRRIAENGESDPVTITRTINGLKEGIAKQREIISHSEIPPVLRGRIGEDASKFPGYDLAIKRQIIKGVADITVKPVKGDKGKIRPVSKRIEWRWLIGGDQAA